jgi:Domain of unknown function (DUF4844)
MNTHRKISASIALICVFLTITISVNAIKVESSNIKDQAIMLTPVMLQDLTSLKSEKKFVPIIQAPLFYPGAPSESIRTVAQGSVDRLISDLIVDLPAMGSKEFVLKRMKLTLGDFDQMDSEERDRLLWYLESILQILNIADSDGLFNTWRYGKSLREK